MKIQHIIALLCTIYHFNNVNAHRVELSTPLSYTVLTYNDHSKQSAIKKMYNLDASIDESVNRTLIALPLREAVAHHIKKFPEALVEAGIPIFIDNMESSLITNNSDTQSDDINRRRLDTDDKIVYENIRILADYTSNSASLTSAAKNALAIAIGWIESALRIIRVSGTFRSAATDTCYMAGIPQTYQDGVTGIDYLLLVTSLSSSCGSSTLGWAISCQIDQNDRPVVGQLNICTNNISTDEISYTVHFFIHEIFHALGFDSSSFAFFRNPYDEMEPLTARLSSGLPPYSSSSGFIAASNTLASTTTAYGTSGYYLVTPVVKSVMANYTGCSSVPGAALEDEGGSSSAASHFEKRIFGPEIMTGVTSRFPMLTAFPLAVLEDSGWYVPRYSEVVEMNWIRNNFTDTTTEEERCAFSEIEHTCPLTGASSSLTSDPVFCSASESVRSCSNDASAASVCSSYTFLDGCMFRSIYSSTSSGTTVYSNCDRKDSTTNSYGDQRTDYSMCTDSSLFLSGSQGMCYPMICNLNKQKSDELGYLVYDSVDMVISYSSTNTQVNCKPSEKGISKSVSGVSGTVTCPDVLKVCFNRPCLNGGFYKNERCICRPGWIGQYCDVSNNNAGRASVPILIAYEDSLSQLQVGQFYNLTASTYFRSEMISYILSSPTWNTTGVKFGAVSTLPDGLFVDPSTGSIVGTPTTASSCLPYTIAAFSDSQQSRIIIELSVESSTPSYPATYAAARDMGCTRIASSSSITSSLPTPVTVPDILKDTAWFKILNPTDPAVLASLESEGVPPLIGIVTPSRNSTELKYESVVLSKTQASDASNLKTIYTIMITIAVFCFFLTI